MHAIGRPSFRYRDETALVISLILHGFLLSLWARGGMYIPASRLQKSQSNGMVYTITYSRVETPTPDPEPAPEPEKAPRQETPETPIEAPSTHADTGFQAEEIVHEPLATAPAEPPVVVPEPEEVSPTPSPSEEQLPEPTPAPSKPLPEPPKIDERSLYQNTPSQAQSGARLEMSGWTWDEVPQPQDQTGERGRVVFEIKIDDTGEVIAIKTLQSTISPVLERTYRDSLMALTFSPTSEQSQQSPVTTGKVTFVIQTK